jgi:branched-chain amino acid transport system substrate-binding protein
LEIHLGLLAPLTGPRQGEGEALQRAAQMAIEEENTTSLPEGRRLALIIRDEAGPWGQSSAQIVHLVFDDQAVAIITSAEGGSAHLAEQVGNKIGVPILTPASDSTTTEINLPWIFRVGPSDAEQAQAFAHDIFQTRKLQRVVLLSQDDRDGRLGSEEFIKAVSATSAVAPAQIVVEPERLAAATSRKELLSAQAVVIWTDAPTARRLSARLNELQPSVPLYLCRKAAEGNSIREDQPPGLPSSNNEDADRWTAAAPESRQARADFSQRYHQRFGEEPGMGAAEVYDAVRILAAAIRQSGPNRTRLRDALAAVSAFPGASGIISFDHAGNDTSQVTLLRLN